MSEGILVICESADGKVKKTALELLGKANDLSKVLGGSVSALLVGDGDAEGLGAYGATKVFQVSGDARNVALLTRAAQKAIEEASPSVVLGGASALGRDVFARLSARLKAGLGAEITEMRVEEGTLVAIRPQFSGKVFSEVKISTEHKLFTVRPGSFAMPAKGDARAEVVQLSVVEEDSDTRLTIVEVIQSEAEVVDLTEADRIVSGGRSVKSKEKFDALIRPLAQALGATAGASRAAVDAHYAEHSEQVGQTGKVVSPALYIACGISGAIQHLAGMNTSRVIVSINKDVNAPIFKHSTYGIVADMFEVVPVLTKALNGGEIPVVNMSKAEVTATSPAATAPQKSAEVVVEATKSPVKGSVTEAKKPVKKMSLKERLAAKRAASKSESAKPTEVQKSVSKVSKPVKSSPPTPSSVQQSSAAPVAGTVISVDVEGLRAEVAELKQLVHSLQGAIASSEKNLTADLKKYVKSTEDALKKDFQRGEKNARSFQEGATKNIEGIERSVTSEVRRIREKTREAMANEGAESRAAIFSLKGSASASIVLNILTLIVLIGMWMTTC